MYSVEEARKTQHSLQVSEVSGVSLAKHIHEVESYDFPESLRHGRLQGGGQFYQDSFIRTVSIRTVSIRTVSIRTVSIRPCSFYQDSFYQDSFYQDSFTHGLSAEGLHLVHEVCILWLVALLREEVGEVLVLYQLHVEIFQHSVRGKR